MKKMDEVRKKVLAKQEQAAVDAEARQIAKEIIEGTLKAQNVSKVPVTDFDPDNQLYQDPTYARAMQQAIESGALLGKGQTISNPQRPDTVRLPGFLMRPFTAKLEIYENDNSVRGRLSIPQLAAYNLCFRGFEIAMSKMLPCATRGWNDWCYEQLAGSYIKDTVAAPDDRNARYVFSPLYAEADRQCEGKPALGNTLVWLVWNDIGLEAASLILQSRVHSSSVPELSEHGYTTHIRKS
ncbi:hypothetical protein [Teichococcus deserti]|uniref:hypothetical protein n=1 Tax=Teichococcus deserti TaxID=1817963 RepID=UPI0010546A9B|nr:hypothetical protein [Pseudoroseomonas deserti]